MKDTLYRKYRAKNEDEFKGNPDIHLKLLRCAETRSEEPMSMPKQFLVTGPSGCGKTTTDRILGAIYGCEATAEEKGGRLYCGKCANCLDMMAFMTDGTETSRPKWYHEYDASSLKAEDIDSIVYELQHPTMEWRLFVFDEAHTLKNLSMGKLLLTIEHLPMMTCAILSTNEPEKLLGTLDNRQTQHIEVSPLSESELVEVLAEICRKESFTYDLKALKLIAKKSRYIPRKAISSLEEISFETKKVGYSDTVRILHHISDEVYIKFLSQLKSGNIVLYMRFLGSLVTEYKLTYKKFVSNFYFFLDTYIAAYLGIDAYPDTLTTNEAKKLFGKLFTIGEALLVYKRLRDLKNSFEDEAQIRLELMLLGQDFLIGDTVKKADSTVPATASVVFTGNAISAEGESVMTESESISEASRKLEETVSQHSFEAQQYMSDETMKGIVDDAMVPLSFAEMRALRMKKETSVLDKYVKD